MAERVDYLPLGSVVVIKGGYKKFVIVGRGLMVNINGGQKYFDYAACEYPEGIIGDRVMYFQHKDINKVIFEGYKDEENELVVQAINDIYTDNKIERADTKTVNMEMNNGENAGRV